MSTQIHIEKVKESKAKDLDFNDIPLGRTFTDHMFLCTYENEAWQTPKIVPMGALPTHPAAMALHYGQAIFEGMKATIDANGTPMLFRPEQNAKRLNFSARRLGMPEFPEELFVEALKVLVDLDKNWIPPQQGSALYLRPFMYADEAFIGMRAATQYKFIIMASPSNPIYTKRVRLYAETNYIRAAHGGTGEAKAAGNYAAAILPTEHAKAKGYDQVLWLDAHNFKSIQEVGTMNIFFKINGKIITPNLDGSILAGITRMSVIELLRHKGYEVTERPISIDEVNEASKDGTLEEAFGTGTAVGIAMIQDIGYKDEDIHVSNESPVGQMVLETINGVRTGEIPDDLNWMCKIKI
ncbi:branched-chain amino acid aminotransferase [Flavobacteriaceae bacterium]|jgi:branched-chain amino acid aminotransferase|nr:branched-chain amino acid aminotransferase [Flavobacteriaceae bacterium]MDC0570891.1 branched-chain amino acid aminotransferase [Flavobacteriaceae bacterium]|tara:strand:+ start:4464 stop:5522 length:1059 start_codon:yes stop_codon:yes gene_type:complete